MSENDEFLPSDLDKAYWAFCDLPEVVELGKQLQDGLIHPVEYAYKIQDLSKIHIG